MHFSDAHDFSAYLRTESQNVQRAENEIGVKVCNFIKKVLRCFACVEKWPCHREIVDSECDFPF